MTDNAFKKLEELYLKEKGLRDEIEKIEGEIQCTELTILDLNADNIDSVSLKYNWFDKYDKSICTSNSYFNYPKLLAKALESYKQELGFLLFDLENKSKDINGLKELILDMEEN